MLCYCAAMRAVALVAFMALQLSMFTCGMNIHLHYIDAGGTHIVSQDDKSDSTGTALADTTCQIHASHVFLDDSLRHPDTSRAYATGQTFVLAALSLPSIHHRIEHPPKHALS